MKCFVRRIGVAVLLSAAGLWTGCGSDETSVKVDPAALESAFGASAADAPAETAPAVDESTTDTLVLPSAQDEVQVKEVAARAASAMRKDEVTEAMVLLQTLRRARNLTPDQLTAVQDQMAALQMDLANRAQNGDQRAQQALQLMQQSTRW